MALAEFLRKDVLDAHHRTLRDLAGPMLMSRSTLANRLDGRAVPWEFVESLIKAAVPAHALEHYLLRARRLWEAADAPAPGGLARLTAPATPAEEREAALEQLATETRDQLARAFDHNRTLAGDLKTAQRMVVLLTMLSAQQHAKLQAADASPQDLADAQERFAQAEKQLAAAQQERQAAQTALDQLRQHTYDLEAKIARLSRTAAPVTEPEDTFELPAELQEEAFLGDTATALRTTEDFLARSREHRQALRGDLALRMTPLDSARRTAERWSTATRLLGRILGCTWLVLAAIVITATKSSRPDAALALADLFTAPLPLAGMFLVTDPWDTVRRLWPVPRALLRRGKIPWPIEVQLAPLTASALRAVTAALTAVGAGLSAACARAQGGHWWLAALLPATLATLGYTLAGNDPHLRTVIKQAARDISDNLSAPVSTGTIPPGASARKVRIAVLDNAWLHDRWSELRHLLTPRRRRVAPWVALLAVLWATVMLTSITPALTRTLDRILGGRALVATVDQPVHRYLTCVWMVSDRDGVRSAGAASWNLVNPRHNAGSARCGDAHGLPAALPC